MSKNNQLLISDDGSHTLLSGQFGVSYHSTHGAIQESITVFLAAGFHYAKHNFLSEIRILEMGFGTGLNALLTLIETEKYKKSVNYASLEAYPISKNDAESLNYIEVLGASQYQDSFQRMHEIGSGKEVALSPNFTFTKHIEKIENHRNTRPYNVVYYDAFAPTTQPELWDDKMMKHVYDMLDEQAVLVSYCAKGSFKRALKSAGFRIEALPGPPGKREMTRAIKGH